MKTKFYDKQNNPFKVAGETEDIIFLVPFKHLNDGGLEYDYSNIKALSKKEPGYPLEKIVSYTADESISTRPINVEVDVALDGRSIAKNVINELGKAAKVRKA